MSSWDERTSENISGGTRKHFLFLFIHIYLMEISFVHFKMKSAESFLKLFLDPSQMFGFTDPSNFSGSEHIRY